MRQHLVCVAAARALCNAQTVGEALGSQSLHFTPGELVGGDFHFDIGSAGSCMLVLQTVLPVMLALDRACKVTLRGGTHNPLAPSADFFRSCFLPQLAAIGAQLDFQLSALGLAPAGRGAVSLASTPSALRPLTCLTRDGQAHMRIHAIVAGVAREVAEREVAQLRKRCQSAGSRAEISVQSADVSAAPDTGPGNVLGVSLCFDNVNEHVTEFGRRGVRAEEVADAAFRQLAQYQAHGAPVGEHLADQLLLPMLLAGGGEFITGPPSEHLRTNALVIEAFGVAKIAITEQSTPRWHVQLTC
jgi:RNA 3'-terminal phosphate cyclase (ATP)